ncbi:MAG: phenylacetate-CoA oxygenase subunit PaaJ [Firmicutes bacterium]|nr:phenylacetate-CoA oxygenase subunit PaaJ [Bacillota bacterium]
MSQSMTPEEVWERLHTVPDPEIPGLSIVDLGMVVSVEVDPTVRIVLRPTFIGCPALDWMRAHVEEALAPHPAEVEFAMTMAWSTTDISEDGRRKLQEFGVAPPHTGDTPVPCPLCGSSDTRRQAAFGSTLCRASYYCEGCHQPFEAWKTI